MLRKFFRLPAKQTRPTDLDGYDPERSIIRMRHVVKSFKTAAGDVTVLKGVDTDFNEGEFIGVIGKSGSGKSTLINMIAGIDRPTDGEVWVGETPVHKLKENQMASWRGRNLGIVFQFFQLLPTLTIVDNVMLPMDFCNMYKRSQRRARALELLDMVEMADHANKLPTAISGGQQQRVAIARALANDPPMIIADEPTGNLDSKTAEKVFTLFTSLVYRGKTVMMVTHDSSLAKLVDRTLIIHDGEIVSEYVAHALPTLNRDQMLETTHNLEALTFAPGQVIIEEGSPVDSFYIVTRGQAEVVLHRPSGSDVVVTKFLPGQFFGEIELLRTGMQHIATIRAAENAPVEVAKLSREVFERLMVDSKDTRQALEQVVDQRIAENIESRKEKEGGNDSPPLA